MKICSPLTRATMAALVTGFLLNACGGAGTDAEEASTAPLLDEPAGTPDVLNLAPTAYAGIDRDVETGTQVSISGTGSDPEGSSLLYSWSISSQPAGSDIQLSGQNARTVRFTPEIDGSYQLRLQVWDGHATSTPDTISINSQTAFTTVAPAAPLNSSYALSTVNIADDFNNSIVTDSAITKSFWNSHIGSSVTLNESGGLLNISSTGSVSDSGYIQSKVNYKSNFFVQPLHFRMSDVSFSGSATSGTQRKLQFALTSTAQSHQVSPDALLLTAQGDGRITLAYKTDQQNVNVANATVLLDEISATIPTDIHLIIDQTSYRIVAQSASGTSTWSGAHDIPKGAWGSRGDSAITIEGLRNDPASNGSTATIQVDAFDMQSLPFFDDFSNGMLTHTGSRQNFWSAITTSASTVQEMDDELIITNTGGSGTQNSRVISETSKDFNFFGQELIFSAGINLTGNMANAGQNVARFGISSSSQLPWSADDSIVLAIAADKRIQLGWKKNAVNSAPETQNVLVNQVLAQVPTHFELRLDRLAYELTAYWAGGQQSFSGDHNIVWGDWGTGGDSAISLAGHRDSSAGSDTAIARWSNLMVTRYQPYYLASSVFAPLGDGISLEVPELGPAHALAQWGMVDVTLPPFNADKSGQEDSTEALQHAINFARQHSMVTFFPAGEYRVSDTLSCGQDLFLRTTGFLTSVREEAPCVLLGSRTGSQRPKIYLAPNSPGFNNPANSKNVIYLWARSYQGNPEANQPNIAINQMLINLDVEVGEGNSGAIGIYNWGAQGSGIQESTINVTHGLAGIKGGAGAGGSHTDITVIGGSIGLDLSEGEPAPTIAGITLTGQTQHAIFYQGAQSLSAVGVKITMDASSSGPAIKVPAMTGSWSAVYGQIALLDSSIEFPVSRSGNKAIESSRSVYLNNVYIRNAGTAVAPQTGAPLLANTSGWMQVTEYAHGERPPVYTDSGTNSQYEAPLYINGIRSTADLIELGSANTAPPADLQSRHLWGTNFPGWESPGAINVKQAPYLAKGDGVTDDTAAIQQAINDNPGGVIFLPKGYYKTSSTIELQANTKLIGLARSLSSLVARSGFGNPNSPQPVLRTANSASGQTIVAFMGLHAPIELPGVYAVQWRTGRNSISRDVNIISRSAWGYGAIPGKPDADYTSLPLAVITGNGGGKWYNFYHGSHWKQNPDYRHLLVDSTSEPLNFYQLNLEHAQSDANAEIRNATNVNIYGLKHEGNFAVLWVRDSNNINVFGFGGNGAAFPATDGYPAGYENYTPTLVRVERTPNFRLINIVDYGRISGSHPVFGVGVDPRLWHAIFENPGSAPLLSNKLDRPVLFMRSN